MDTTHHAGDSRAQLEGWLTYLQNLLRTIDARWAEKAAVAQRYAPMIPLKRKWGFGLYSAWTAGLVIVLTAVGTPIIQAWAKAEALAAGSVFYPNIQALYVAVMMTPVALILALVIILLRNKLILPKLHAKTEQANNQRQFHNDTVLTEEQRVDAQLHQAGKDFAENIGDRFPQAYMYDEAVGFCVQMVRNHRAATDTDALNLYETELHRQRMENMQAWQLAEAQRATRMAAVGNVINAAMSGAVIGTLRHEGAMTRAAMNRPVNIKIR